MSPGLVTNAPAVPEKNVLRLESVVEGWENSLRFYLNGTRVILDNIDPEITLLEYLRGIGLTGTKLGCAEGGCGACTVVISQYNPTTRQIYHASVNACLAPLISVDGKHVITVEGIGNSKNPHPVQERIAKWHGSQCGFCTPGIVMSLYALLRNNPDPSQHDIEEAFDGNLCRCTGYRPILDAAQTFSREAGCGKLNGAENGAANGGGCCMAKDGKAPPGCCRNKENNEKGEEAPIKRFTPPDFIELKPDQELIFPASLKKHDFKPLAFGNSRKRWLRPVTVQQLLAIKEALPSSKIIGGSTETQIEIKFKAMHYAVSVYVGDIPELKQYTFEKDYVEIGANITLTDLEIVTQRAIEHYGTKKAQPFAAMLKQLRYFAGRQIRNVGTPAGNLVTASPISDLNPVFLAARSTLIAQSTPDGDIELPMESFFKAYRETALPANAILSSIKIPVSQEKGEFLRAYKQSKRKDDDIAIVTATLRVFLNDDNIVKTTDLAYGGMAPTTIGAQKTMDYLVGKEWGKPEILEGAMNALEQDFNLKFSVPGGMAVYRRSLALGFFYRFWHDTLAELKGDALEPDVIPEIEREISTGQRDQEATLAYEQKIYGKGVPHVAAMQQATGEAVYTDDISPQRGELYGCLVLSTKAHARLLNVDPSGALELPGVKGYVDHKDLPSAKANYWGIASDEVFFAVDEIFTAGQPIGMIVAETPQQATAAARAVKIEYGDLPAIFTMEEAIEANSFFPTHRRIRRGRPIDEALQEADHVFSGESRMGGQEHFYLETNATIAIPKENGEMEIISSTQNPNETQLCVSQVLGVPSNRIVAKVKRLGGGFGGKESRSVQLAAICATAAGKLRKPVRCMLNRDEDIITSGQRHPFLGRWTVGVQKDGRLHALKADIFNNAGWSQDLSVALMERALSHIDNTYFIPHVDVNGRCCKTNTVSNTAFRGFGGPQGMWICESIMEYISDKLKIPVEKLRQINFYKEGECTHFNQALVDWHVPVMYEELKTETEYEKRRQEVDAFNAAHKWKKRGISIIPTKFGISFTALHLNQAGALVHIYHDGSVLVAHGGTEMGQGLHTKMCMVAAEALEVPLENVYISETSTATVSNTSPTAASASSDLNGYAVKNACDQLIERLKPIKGELGPNASFKEIVNKAYFKRVNLSANGFYQTPDIGYDWNENKGGMFFYFTQGVAVAEVEIDTLTGDFTVLRADIKMDIGRSINPAIDYGQIEGAFIQGQGLFTTEESLWLRNNGQIFTRGPGAYKIPGFRDVPQIFNVSFLKNVEWKKLFTIQKSKGVGEPPLFMASSVFFAIRDALKSARKDHGEDEVLLLKSPATPERIRLACADPIVKRSQVKMGEGENSWFIEI